MSQSLPNLVGSFVFGVFYTVTSIASLPATLISNRMFNNDEYDDYADEWDRSDDYRWHYDDGRRKDPVLATSIDPAAVNPQNDCPLFNGRIPPEIRTMIFRFACMEEDDEDDEYDDDEHYCRPGYTHRKVIYTQLLMTCKAIYLETYKLPASLNEHRFWLERGPPEWEDYHKKEDYTYEMVPDILRSVKTLHFFVQQYSLDRAFANALNVDGFYEGVEHIIITFRRGDWWFWEQEQKMTIHPSMARVEYETMKAAWGVEDASGGMHSYYQTKTSTMSESEKAAYRTKLFSQATVDGPFSHDWFGSFGPASWGNQFTRFTKLKTLDIQFETAAYNRPQLNEIVAHALKWRFPFTEGKVLGNAAVTDTLLWEGPECLRASSGYPSTMPKGVSRDDMEMKTVTWYPVTIETDK